MVTIKEIAKRAGVSVGTVDRVIHDRGRVSKATTGRVKQIIAELDYKPNILARSLSRLKTFQFGVLMPQVSPDNHYWELAIQGIEKAHQELKIHKINISYFPYDGYSEKAFIEASNRVLQAKLDGLLMAPTIYKTFDDEFVQRIPRNLPYVFFNSTIPAAKNLSYIGQDSYQSGMLAGNLMLMSTHLQGTLVILTMLHDDYHISKRQQGFEDYVRKNSNMSIKVYGAMRAEDRETFLSVLDRIFSENDDLQGIYVTTALTYYVAEYLQCHHELPRIRVIGHDLTDENVKYLKQGLIHFLIGQRPEYQGYQGIYALYRHVVTQEPVPPYIMMPLDIVTQANIDYYLPHYVEFI
ncbi:MAG: substrate-binding domain-containing protein [candidate division KSB1 bacterium]|nr:substrate-binding domain-containing protein [candidate division KSB1 bacterium]MDZ7318988.1 substrate-binding domain-containing protein [candidate division KSB1 bacterium]